VKKILALFYFFQNMKKTKRGVRKRNEEEQIIRGELKVRHNS